MRPFGRSMLRGRVVEGAAADAAQVYAAVLNEEKDNVRAIVGLALVTGMAIGIKRRR